MKRLLGLLILTTVILTGCGLQTTRAVDTGISKTEIDAMEAMTTYVQERYGTPNIREDYVRLHDEIQYYRATADCGTGEFFVFYDADTQTVSDNYAKILYEENLKTTFEDKISTCPGIGEYMVQPFFNCTSTDWRNESYSDFLLSDDYYISVYCTADASSIEDAISKVLYIDSEMSASDTPYILTITAAGKTACINKLDRSAVLESSQIKELFSANRAINIF